MPDLLAKNIIYHVSCYKIYTNPRQLTLFTRREPGGMHISLISTEAESHAGKKKCITTDKAFDRLAQLIEGKLKDDTNHVMNLTSLCNTYTGLLNEGEQRENYRTPVQGKATAAFWNIVSFSSPSSCQ